MKLIKGLPDLLPCRSGGGLFLKYELAGSAPEAANRAANLKAEIVSGKYRRKL
jgi:hypothetical protein